MPLGRVGRAMRAPTGCGGRSHCTVGRHALMPPPLPGRLRGAGRCGHRPLQISTAPVGAAISRPRVDEGIDPYAACCNYVRRGGCPHPPVGLWPLRGRVDEGIDPYSPKKHQGTPLVFFLIQTSLWINTARPGRGAAPPRSCPGTPAFS